MSARVSAQPATVIKDLFPPPPPFQVPPPPASDLTSIATGDLNVPCRMSGSAHEGQDPLPPAPELQFQIAVGRYVGPTNPDGTLVHAAQMIEDGTLGPFAELTLVFYESILTDQLGGGCTPPRHRLMYNGQWLADGVPGEPGTIQSFGRGWRSQTFRVPISWVRFPAEPGPEPGIAPTPAVNDIHIAWDPVTPLALACNTCIAVSSMSQRQWAASPVILIHGTGQSADWWHEHGAVSTLQNAQVQTRTVNFLPPRNTASANALRLQFAPGTHGIPLQAVSRNGDLEAVRDSRIETLASQLGAWRVHLLCHSKGGLDARRWLDRLYSSLPGGTRVRILSSLTLSTPHNGSVLADWAVERWALRSPDGSLGWPVQHHGFPISSTAADTLSLLGEPGADYPDLTTERCSMVNARELPFWPSGVARAALGADMDENASASVVQMLEVREIAADTNELRMNFVEGGPEHRYLQGVNVVYPVLKAVDHVQVGQGYFTEPVTNQRVLVPRITAVTPPGTIDTRNDVLVTVSSAIGYASYASVGAQARTFVFEGPEFPGPTGPRNAVWAQNHSSIGGPDVALCVVRSWLIPIDIDTGDLP